MVGLVSGQKNVIVDVLIIGAGISGLCVASRLDRTGLSYLVLEQADDIGGTWRDNTYPGCGCDIPAPLYSYSFAQRSDWSRLFARQPEIFGYLKSVAAKLGLERRIRFGAKVVSATWHEASQTWSAVTEDGSRIRCRFLVSAIGALPVPRYPNIADRDVFAGTSFHSATWDHSVDLRDKRIAVIGTGASAVQFIPLIAPGARHLDVFQRTPSWIIPKPDLRFTKRQRLLRKLPPYRWFTRAALFWINESRIRGFVGGPHDLPALESQARNHLAEQIPDAALKSALTPDYSIGCKRVLLSNDYYPTLMRNNVALQTDPISNLTADGIVTADGVTHSADVIIYGTGFDAQFGFREIEIIGRDGRRLAERWQQGREAYLGTMVSGFPNYFVMLGPNSALGHNSQIFMIEAQARYILSCLRQAKRNGIGVLDVRETIEVAFNEWLQERLSESVWQSGGCQSWYQHPTTGKNTALWPSSTIEFWWRTHRAQLADFDTRPRWFTSSLCSEPHPDYSITWDCPHFD